MSEQVRVSSPAPGRPRRADRRRPTPRVDALFVTIIVLAIGKAWLSRALGLGSANPLWALGLEAAAIVFLLGAIDLIAPRRSYTVDLIAYSILSLVMLANVMYLAFYGAIFSPRLLSVVGQAGEVGESIKDLLKPVYLLYLIDIPFLVAWAVALRRRPSSKARAAVTGRSRAVAIATAVAAVLLVVQVGYAFSAGAEVDTKALAKSRGFGAYQLASVLQLVLPDPTVSQATAFEHDKTLTPQQAAARDMTLLRGGQSGPRIGGVTFGQYRGKNVITIQVEALQDLVINKRYAGQEITPNLNRLIAGSWYFPNTYSQTSSGNTVDAEFTANTSLLAPANGAASIEYSDRELPGLPRLLRTKLGYDAITLHQNGVRFWNRIELYPALGFRRYWDKDYFKNRDKMWHASDQALFSMGMKVLRSEATSDTPFYSMFITESSHTPFVAVPQSRWPLKLSAKDANSYSGRYVGSISYTDKAFGEFFSALKSSGLWDNSIIVIYGDHSALLDKMASKGDPLIGDKLLGRPYSDVDRQRIPLIIHLPGQTAGRVENQTVGQVDIMPTIADLVGLDLADVPHVGRSVFKGAPSMIPTRAYLPGGSVVDDKVLFMPQLSFADGSAVNVQTGQSVQPSPAEQTAYENAKKLSALSDAWVRSLPKRADAKGNGNAILPH